MIPRSGTGRRNLFVVASIVCFGLAMACGLSPRAMVQDVLGYTSVIILVFGSMGFMFILRNLAHDVLVGDQQPWYVRPGAFVLLPIMLVVMTLGSTFVLNEMLEHSNLAMAFPPLARVFVSLSTQFAWIVILDVPQPSAYTPPEILEPREPRRARHLLPRLDNRINPTYPHDSITKKRILDAQPEKTVNGLTKHKRWRKHDAE